GLSNLGNTCFMNSVIQALANTPQLQQYFLDEKFNQHINTKNPLGVGGRMAKAFYVVVRRLWDGSKQAFSPHEFKDVVGLKDSRFTDGMQHDAQEFMAFLLDMLHEDLNTATGPHTVEQEESEEKMATDAWRSHVSRAGSFIVENFHGMLQSELECLKCKTKSIKFDPFLFLPVPLPKKSSKHDLHKCLDLFIEPEVLSQDEAWYCPKCKKHMQAVKKMSLWDLPDVLIVQLKRFSFKNYLWRDKISMFIDMPVKNLDMSTYCNNPRKTKSMSYDLFAVINHHGGILGGHYTTDVSYLSNCVLTDWRTCDDSRVTKLNRKIVTEAAYVMFYLRRSSKSVCS
uniref:ubiquitinyl hydrolase 1 n=1 Tax=Ciona savignyi TaxID=51511 RepID=H2YLT4_CIOSA